MSSLSFCPYGSDTNGNCLDEQYDKTTKGAPVSYSSEIYNSNTSVKEGHRDISGNKTKEKEKDDEINDNIILYMGLFIAVLGATTIVLHLWTFKTPIF